MSADEQFYLLIARGILEIQQLFFILLLSFSIQAGSVSADKKFQELCGSPVDVTRIQLIRKKLRLQIFLT